MTPLINEEANSYFITFNARTTLPQMRIPHHNMQLLHHKGSLMRLEWIDDLLAILQAGSMNRAAEQRYLSQPAFSRRIKSIEDYVGVPLIDRSRKPAHLSDTVMAQQQRLEELSVGIRDLLYDLRQQERKTQNRVVIAGQHSSITSKVPALIKTLVNGDETDIVIRLGNRDECFFMLATNQADLAFVYRVPQEKLPLEGYLIEECELGTDYMIPVFSSEHVALLNQTYQEGEIPVITYPQDVFFGQVVNREIFSILRSRIFLRAKAETSLTFASLQLALEGVGIGWVPKSVAARYLGRGDLVDLSETLMGCELNVCAVRIGGEKSAVETEVWDALSGI